MSIRDIIRSVKHDGWTDVGELRLRVYSKRDSLVGGALRYSLRAIRVCIRAEIMQTFSAKVMTVFFVCFVSRY